MKEGDWRKKREERIDRRKTGERERERRWRGGGGEDWERERGEIERVGR